MNVFTSLISQYSLHKNDKIDYSSIKKQHQEENIILYTVAEYFNKEYDKEWVKNSLGRKWKSNVSDLLSFIDLYKYLTERKEQVRALPISCTCDFMIEVFGNSRNASNVLSIAQKVDLLHCVVNDYQFGGYNDSYNKAKQYILNKRVQDIILELGNEYNITHKKYSKQYTIYNSGNIRNKVENYDILFDKVKINSKLRIADPCGHKNRDAFEETCNAILDEKYPQMAELKNDANYIDSQPFYLDHPELQVKIRPHYEYSRGGLVSKIGLRATNRIVSLKEHDNGKECGKKWRKEYLKELFGTENYQSYDVKASIYQLTYALNTNDWLDNKVDMYSEIFGNEWEYEGQRNEFKSLCMPLYFERTNKTAVHHLRQKARLNEIMTDEESNFAVMSLRNNMINALGGKLYDSEIFLHESVIYNHVTMELVRQGWDIVQVYDGFYGMNKDDRDLKKDIDTILTDYITYYINTYINKDKEQDDKEDNQTIIYNSGNIQNEDILEVSNTIQYDEDDEHFFEVMRELESRNEISHSKYRESIVQSKDEEWLDRCMTQRIPTREEIDNAYEPYSVEWYDSMIQNGYIKDSME